MRPSILLAAAALAGCSTVPGLREKPTIATLTTSKSLQAFGGCLSERTASQQVNYLPRPNGASFSAGAGPQRFIFWTVDVDDLGSVRRVSVYAVNRGLAQHSVLPAVQACI